MAYPYLKVFRDLSPNPAPSFLLFKATPGPHPLVVSMEPIVKRLVGLTPAPKLQDSNLREGSACPPPQPGLSALGEPMGLGPH